MKHKGLVAAVASKLNQPESEVDRMLEATVEILKSQMVAGNMVSFQGFGSFEFKRKEEPIMNNYDDVQLGQDYQDSVTGFVGTATAKAEYLHTSASVRLEALVDKNRSVNGSTSAAFKPRNNKNWPVKTRPRNYYG